MSYYYLAAAILTEVLGTISMKASDGLARPIPTVLVFVFYGLSLAALSFAVKRIDISVAYAIWSGVGIALITVAGVFMFKETITPLKLLCLIMIAVGCIGLNLVGNGR